MPYSLPTQMSEEEMKKAGFSGYTRYYSKNGKVVTDDKSWVPAYRKNEWVEDYFHNPR